MRTLAPAQNALRLDTAFLSHIWAREPGLRSLLARSAAGPALTRPVPEAASNRESASPRFGA